MIPGDFEFSLEDLKIDEILSSRFVYDQSLIYGILDGRTVELSSYSDILKNENMVVKIEGCEKLSPLMFSRIKKLALDNNFSGPITCHLFISPKGSESFGIHTDPDDVLIYVVSGEKSFIVSGQHHTVKQGEFLNIPRDTPHAAINNEKSVTLSIGFELYLHEKI